MAIDFQQVYTKIKEIGAAAQQRKKTLAERRIRARMLLEAYAEKLDELRDKVESAKAEDPALRCALPLNEPLDTHHPAPALPLNVVLIAADGSQINPDRHGALQFGLINVGALVMRHDSGQAPQVFTDSQLLFDEELFTPSGSPITDGMVALRRDLQERSKLAELAAEMDESAPVVTFTDGPIELWGSASGEDAAAYADSLEKYKSVLSRLCERDVVTAGYVDKPSADLVIRLLELIDAPIGQVANLPHEKFKLREYHPLRGVSDRWLFGEKKNPLLKPGERSAVFKIQTKNESNYTGALALHFFYLNAGTEGRPWPVRVEIPRWVADDPQKLDLLHAVLVNQCRMMGSKPYPYLLHRAHETAVVSFEEKNQIEQLLTMELRRAGEETDDGSNKQAAKDLPGRASYKG